MKSQQKNVFNKKIKISIFILLFIAIVFLPAKKPAQAVDCWFIPCDGIFTTAMEYLQKALLAILKEEGMNMISDSVGDAAEFIKNTDEYLKTDPVKSVNKEFDTYLTKTLAQGKSASNYITNTASSAISFNSPNFEGIGQDSFKIGLYQNYSENNLFLESVNAASSSGSSSNKSGNYISDLVNSAKKATTEKAEEAVTYVGNPADMFNSAKNDGFKKMNEYASGINNPWAFNSYAEGVYKEKVAEAKEIAKTTFIAGQGFLPTTDSSGNIKTPAITTKDIVSDSKTTGNKILANAQDIPTAMISMILSLASDTIKNGVSGGEKTSKDNTEEKNMLQKEMEDLSSSATMEDAMGDMTIQDILFPSLLRKLFGDE